jgi:PAS domain S-box-containing protein
MNYQNKTRKDLIKELQELQKEHNSLKTLYEKDITERKLTEEALQREKNFAESIIATAQIIILVLDKQGRIIRFNPYTEEILGYKLAEVQGKDWFSIFLPKSDVEEVSSVFLKAICEIQTHGYINRIVTRDGSERQIEWYDKTLKDIQGNIIGLLSVGQDITEHKHAEDKLREMNERLKLAQVASKSGTWDWDITKNTLYWSEEFLKIFGMPADVTPGFESWKNTLHPDDIQKVSKSIQDAIDQKKDLLNDYSIITPSGETKWIRATGKTTYDKNNKPVRMIGLCTDISELKRNEILLLKSEGKYRLLFHGLKEAVYVHETIHDGPGKFFEVNESACKMLGYTKEEFLQMEVKNIDEPEQAAKIPAIHKKLFKDGNALFETHHITKDGRRVPVEVNIQLFELEGKSMVLSVARDITDRRKAEELIRESEDRYRDLVENSQDLICTHDLEGRIISVNPWAAKVLGYEKDAILQKNIRDFLAPEVLRGVQVYLARIRKNGTAKGLLQVQTAAGERRIWEYNNTLRTDGTTIPIVRGMAHDITERKLAEDKLLRQYELVSRITETSPVGITILNSEGQITFANARAEKVLGLTKDKITRRYYNAPEWGITDLEGNPFPDEELPFQRVMASAHPVFDVQHAIQWSDGRRVLLSVNAAPILDASGAPEGMIATLTDITEYTHAEKALRLEKENFRHSLDDSPLGIRIATIKGNTIYANKTLLDFYGYDNLEELQNTLLKKRYTPESYKQAQKRKRRRERGDLSDSEYEISIVRRNGEIRHLQVFRKEVLWDGLMQFQIIYNDITERKYGEEEIKKSKKLLEDLHRHLDEIRENERAVISREIHDQIGQSLTALKLDLNQIHTYINTNPEAVVKLESMIELVSNTIQIVQRISSDLRPGILDDLGLISAIEWYTGEFEDRTGIKCRLISDDSIYNDSQKNLILFRVLQEAFTNIIRHAKASSVTVKLHHTQKGTTLTIQDNGIGITWEKIESAKSLGLIGMRERLKQLEGMVNISTGKGHGTKLTIFIPEKKKSES